MPESEERSGCPTVRDVAEIAALADPVMRNLRITLTYHELARATATLTGSGANWCAFAVWASRQAGQTIRGEDVLHALERTTRLRPEVVSGLNRVWRRVITSALSSPGTRRSRLVALIGRSAFARAADAVARGNLKVFAEIGHAFAAFLAAYVGRQGNENEIQFLLNELRPGEPPDGQEYLRRAFASYVRAIETDDPGTKAELLLYANLLIGLHEQTRLQPEILEALEVPSTTVLELGRQLLAVVIPGSRSWFGVVRTPLAAVMGALGRSGEAALRSLLRESITESLMTLSFPDQTVRLGRDLPGDVPEPLRDPKLPELRALLERYRPALSDRDVHGADDWSDLVDRMTLICRLFHLRHDAPDIFLPPFTAEQVQLLAMGRVPDGAL